MKVILAGFNVDTDILHKLNTSGDALLTPETFSAAYARISRSAQSVTELRRDACKDVERARQSNKTIIFEMGHHSVAEHAVFNFDIMGISRLAFEELEKFRLASYTEKSQRYVTLEGDYVLPEEIKEKTLQKRFNEMVSIQNAFYQHAYEILRTYVFNKHAELAANPRNNHLLEGWAKEDARYALSLATEGQAGMTINARNLEHLFRRFRMSSRIEVQHLGHKIYELVMKVSPSIILFAEPSHFEKELYPSLNKEFDSIRPIKKRNPFLGPEIISYTKNGDNVILAVLLSIIKSIDYLYALQEISALSETDKEKLYKKMLGTMQFFDRPPREFEFVDIAFQAVISASNFAQLKRHRIVTLISGSYDIELGNTIPESIIETGLTKPFQDIIDKTNELYFEIKKEHGTAADYILTNSHRRLVLMKMNMRQLYHFARLRADEHAQWDIRNLAQQLINQVKKLLPYSTLLLCGKSDLPDAPP
ncbi:MAG: thymidylate synthase, flavin-dependent [Candidatus Fischerbacteria bacterium RBG_13_37_8]|uniref:FAD-dependent thymidylate synthase n=1 Tax=Candidatus Fischerbacteria bacterium RBG_13_37_8 TaxID=1817863 RepID=A0A1F5VWR1_9BACT|nr:MAG: thymidylate synthase, flavin-dependent [Candidatus Fischerbacteria bacterium RBG_13_37_8]